MVGRVQQSVCTLVEHAQHSTVCQLHADASCWVAVSCCDFVGFCVFLVAYAGLRGFLLADRPHAGSHSSGLLGVSNHTNYVKPVTDAGLSGQQQAGIDIGGPGFAECQYSLAGCTAADSQACLCVYLCITSQLYYRHCFVSC